ncbi:MAG: hypothetical protein WDO13_01020 [Verrucomicrobiota bacterium]
MHKIFLTALCLGAFLTLNASAKEKATVGHTAPNFTLTGSDGQQHSLATTRASSWSWNGPIRNAPLSAGSTAPERCRHCKSRRRPRA